jgi:hypothetical protein
MGAIEWLNAPKKPKRGLEQRPRGADEETLKKEI